jgi:hypothetical protein
LTVEWLDAYHEMFIVNVEGVTSRPLIFGQFTRSAFPNHEAPDTPICDRNSVDHGGVVGMFFADLVRRECGR